MEKTQRSLVIASAALFAAAVAAEGVLYPEETRTGEATPLTFVGAAVAILAHGLWVTLDLRRRGRPAGAWRFLAYLLGPFAVVAYLVKEYPDRKLRQVALYFGIILAAALAGLGTAFAINLALGRR